MGKWGCQKRKNRWTGNIERKCIVCGDVFWAYNKDITRKLKSGHIRKGAKYCSRKCYLKKTRGGMGQVPMTCLFCKKEFLIPFWEKKKGKRKFCSTKCSGEGHRTLPRKSQQIQLRLKFKFLKTRFLVLQRDGFKCQYCGRGQKDGAVLQIDHKYPKSKGGLWVLPNLITACKECNLGKRDMLLQPMEVSM